MSASMSSIDAKLKLITQRMKLIENNEQVISRTVVSQKKKIQELEKSLSAGGGNVDVSKLKTEILNEIKPQLIASGVSGDIRPPLEEGFSRRESSEITTIKKSIELLHQEVNELKYIIDSINPLEYITLEQLNDAIDRKLDRLKH